MLRFYPVSVDYEIHRSNPLYVGNFFQLKGMWWKKRRLRQSLVISIALGWYSLARQHLSNPAFMHDELYLTALRRQVHDAHLILEAFFHIDQLGYNFSDGTAAATQVRPRRLDQGMVDAIEALLEDVRFDPGMEPTDDRLVKSRVKVQRVHLDTVKQRLTSEGRDTLWPAVQWICSHTELDFYYSPSGRLQARDTSVWPVRAIETWPAWLRQTLFGRVIDLENSYCQFLVSSLADKYENNLQVLRLKYPDLMRAHEDKVAYREEICSELLRLPRCDESMSVVKRLLMSLANGSNITPALLVGGSSRSEAVRIILEAAPHLSTEELTKIGRRLSHTARQFRSAKRDLCSHLLGCPASAVAAKKIFSYYFQWEREARYRIWNAVGRTGIMMHDGVDGIQSALSDEELVSTLAREEFLKVSVESAT